jgi:hypothetical protein
MPPYYNPFSDHYRTASNTTPFKFDPEFNHRFLYFIDKFIKPTPCK